MVNITKILITGSTGFIGQHLLPKLEKNFVLIPLISDLNDHDKVLEEVLTVQPDLVVHLAARTEVEKSFYEQTVFSQVNYVGTVNLIESMLKCKNIPKLIFASTMEVYGWQPVSDQIKTGYRPGKIPVFDESTIPNPNAPYAVAKLACEKYIEYASRSYGLEFVILRQTNSYGRKDNNYFVTEQIISQMLLRKTCNLGYKDPYRNFLYVDDLIHAWMVAVEKFNNCKNKTYTLGPPNAIRIEDYANLIADKLGWDGKILWNTKPSRPGEIFILNSDFKQFNKDTGWKPVVSLSDGLDRTIDTWKKIIL